MVRTVTLLTWTDASSGTQVATQWLPSSFCLLSANNATLTYNTDLWNQHSKHKLRIPLILENNVITKKCYVTCQCSVRRFIPQDDMFIHVKLWIKRQNIIEVETSYKVTQWWINDMKDYNISQNKGQELPLRCQFTKVTSEFANIFPK